MPRGRKRKVDLESAADEESMMDDPMETSETGETTEAETEPKNDTQEEQEGEEDRETEMEPGEVVPEEPEEENQECPPQEKLTEVVPDAKEDLSHLDVLVCGRCNNVFHFIPQLSEHKEKCPGHSSIISTTTRADNKPQVWAFVLYKAFKMREVGQKNEQTDSSWQWYQKWSALEDVIKKTWVEAGKAIMGLQHATPLQAQKRARSVALSPTEQHKQTLLQLQKELEDDPEPIPIRANRTPKETVKRVKKEESEDDLESQINPHTINRGKRAGTNQVWRKSLRKDAAENENELFTVEKIVAKRANPKLKSAEYLVKWVGLTTEHNSWEHASNLLTCKPIVEEFERNLARQKARKAAEAQRKNAILNPPPTTAGGRPIRNSALKAMEHVKEWSGAKRVDSDLEDDVPDIVPERKRVATPGKSVVLMANSKGTMKLDQNQVANLSSGVYIISDNAGMVKVDDRVANKLQQSCIIDQDGQTIQLNSRTMMIDETEVRKIPAKMGAFKKAPTGLFRKENNLPLHNVLQKRPLTSTPKPAVTRQVVLGGNRRALPGPMPSPLRAPKPKISINPATGRPHKMVQRVLQQQRVMKIVEDEDGLSNDDSNNICSITGQVLGQADNETLPNEGDEGADGDEDGMMRVSISPGGSLHQIVQDRSSQRERQQSQQEQEQETELMQFEGEDGVIYQLTAEQQQMLLQNGTLTMDAKNEPLEENMEMVLENGQIVRRTLDGEAENGEEQYMLAGEGLDGVKVEQMGEGEDMMTLQSAVQEAVQGPHVTISTEDGTNMEAIVVQAEPLEAGATTRRVVLQLIHDGSLVTTDMDEEQFQSLQP